VFHSGFAYVIDVGPSETRGQYSVELPLLIGSVSVANCSRNRSIHQMYVAFRKLDKSGVHPFGIKICVGQAYSRIQGGPFAQVLTIIQVGRRTQVAAASIWIPGLYRISVLNAHDFVANDVDDFPFRGAAHVVVGHLEAITQVAMHLGIQIYHKIAVQTVDVDVFKT